MSDEPKKKRRFPAVLDLTSKAQEAAKIAANPPPAAEEHAASDEGLDTSLDSLPASIAAAVRSAGWDRLMPVQARTLPYMLEGRDLIVQSKTGSGKTGAFLLPLFDVLDPAVRGAQALVLTPTRELAKQIYEEFLRLKGNRPETDGLDAVLVYGGVGYGEQTAGLKSGAQLVIGTPGRILDHLERRTLNLDRLKVLVLDEADEMLSMGFLPAMNKLRRYLPDERQSTMFSATMPPMVRRLAETFLTDPAHLSLAGGSVQVDALAHRYYVVPGMGKDRALVRLIELENPETAILFANTKREVEYLAQFLRNYGHDAGELSGDLNQNAREAIMQRLRDGNLRFLVATDVAARGIDISDLSHVIQYDVPQDPEYYVHRAGRTARAGKTGVSITLTSAEDKNKLLAIARRYDLDFEERPLPTDEEVTERVRERLTTLLEDRYRDTRTLARERAARFDPLAASLAEEEPHLLSMLLDQLYHESLHAQPQHELNTLAAQRAQERREREWDDDGRGGRGRRRRGDRRDEPRSDRREGRRDDREDDRRSPRAETPAEPSETPHEERLPVSDVDRDAPVVSPVAPTREPVAGDAPPEGDRSRRRKKRRRGDRRDRDDAAPEVSDEAPLDAEAADVEEERVAETAPTTTSDVDAFEAAWEEPAAAPVLGVSTIALDAIDADERPGRRRGRGRGRRREDAPEGVAPEAVAAEPAPEASEPLAPELPASSQDVTPDAPAGEASAPESSATEASARKPKAARAPKKPSGLYSVFELRAMSDEALRGVGQDLLDTLPEDRSDLLYAILDAQAVRESAGRNRRGKPAPPRRGDRRDRSSEKRPAAKPEAPPRGRTPAPPPPSSPPAASSKAEKDSRRRRRRKPDAPAIAPLPTTGADALPPPPAPVQAPAAAVVPDAPAPKPTRSRAKKTNAAPAVEAAAPTPAKPARRTKKADAEAPAPPEAAPPKRSRAKKADADAATAPAAEDAKPTRTRAKKTEAPADATPPAAPAPAAPKRAKKATGADAPAPPPGDAPAPPKRTRAKKSTDDTTPPVEPAAPKRTRAKKSTD